MWDKWLGCRRLFGACNVRERVCSPHCIRDDEIADKQLCVRARCIPQALEDLACVGVRPVMGDAPKDEDGRIENRLRREEVVRWGSCVRWVRDGGLMGDAYTGM